MARCLLFLAAAGFVIFLGGSTPTLAQTCQQKCDAQYPNSYTDKNQRVMKARCINACNKK
jgi:hypothetical protein